MDRRRFLGDLFKLSAAVTLAPGELFGAKTEKEPYREMVEYYLSTAGKRVDRSDPNAVVGYLKSTFQEYLDLPSVEGLEFPEVESYLTRVVRQIYEAQSLAEMSPSLSEISQRLSNRFEGARKIQESIALKVMEDRSLNSEVQKRRIKKLTDGRIGSYSLSLLNNILGRKMDIGETMRTIDVQDTFEQLLTQINEGELHVLRVELTGSEQEYVNKIQTLLEQNKIDDEIKYNSPSDIPQRLAGAQSVIHQKMAGIRDQSMMRVLQSMYVHYLCESWLGSSGRRKDGNAKYPFEKNMTADCSTFVYGVLKEVFPDISPTVMQGFPYEQLREYQKSIGGNIFADTHLFSTQASVYIGGKSAHMYIVAPDFNNTNIFVKYEASTPVVTKSPFIPQQGDEWLRVTNSVD